jgi:hypothetical protein
MALFAHVVQHLLITDLAVFESSLGVLHPGPSLHKAKSRLSLKWLGSGEGLSGLGGGGAYDSAPHDST